MAVTNREILFVIKLRNDAKNALRGLGADFKKTAQDSAKAAQQGAKAQREFNKSVGKSKKGFEGLRQQLKRTGGAIAVLDGPLGGVSGRFTLLAQLLGQVGPAAAAVALSFAGLALAMRQVFTVVGGFQKEMQAVRAITQASNEEFAKLSNTARAMGAATVFSATEAASGMQFLARAGFDVNEVISAIGPTLDLAIAGAIGLAEAADIISNIMSGFGIATERTAAVADVLAFTAANSNTNILQLGETMKFAAPIATSLGVSLNETAAAAGVLGDAGVQASLAGTNIRQVLLKLVSFTPKADKALKKLGLSFSDIDPRVQSLTSVFEKFAAVGLDASAAAEIFGIRQAGAAVIITENVAKLGELSEASKDVAGFASEAADVMADNLIDAMKGLVSVVQEAIVVLGEAGLADALRTTIDTIRDTVVILFQMDQELKTSGEAAKFFAVGIGLATAAVVLLINKFIAGGILKILTSLGTAFGTATGFAFTFAGSIRAVAAAFRFLLGPIGLLILAVEALIFFWDDIVDLFDEYVLGVDKATIATRNLKDAQDELAKTPQDIIQAQKDALQAQIATTRAALKENEEAVKTIQGQLARAQEGDRSALGPLPELRIKSFEEGLKIAQQNASALRDELIELEEANDRLSTSTDLATKAQQEQNALWFLGGAGAQSLIDAISGIRDEVVPNAKAIRELNEDLANIDEVLQRVAAGVADGVPLADFEKELGVSIASLRTLRDLRVEAFEAGRVSLEKTIEGIKEETEAARLSSEERKIAVALAREQKALKEQAIILNATEIGQLEDALRLLELTKNETREREARERRQVRAQESFIKKQKERAIGFAKEAQLIGKTGKEAEKLEAVFATIEEATLAGFNPDQIREYAEATAEAFDEMQKLEQLAREGGFGDGISEAFQQMSEDVKTFKELVTESTLAIKGAFVDAFAEIARTGTLTLDTLVNDINEALISIFAEQAVNELSVLLGGLFDVDSPETKEQEFSTAVDKFTQAVNQFSGGGGPIGSRIPGKETGGFPGEEEEGAIEEGIFTRFTTTLQDIWAGVFDFFDTDVPAMFDSAWSTLEGIFGSSSGGGIIGSIASLFGFGGPAAGGGSGGGGGGSTVGTALQIASLFFAKKGGLVPGGLELQSLAQGGNVQRPDFDLSELMKLGQGAVPIIAHENESVIPANEVRQLMAAGLMDREGRLTFQAFQQGGLVNSANPAEQQGSPRDTGKAVQPRNSEFDMGEAPISIQVNVEGATDADSFLASGDQIALELAAGISRVRARRG